MTLGAQQQLLLPLRVPLAAPPLQASGKTWAVQAAGYAAGEWRPQQGGGAAAPSRLAVLALGGLSALLAQTACGLRRTANRGRLRAASVLLRRAAEPEAEGQQPAMPDAAVTAATEQLRLKWEEIRDEISGEILEELKDGMIDAAWESLRNELRGQVEFALREELEDDVRRELQIEYGAAVDEDEYEDEDYEDVLDEDEEEGKPAFEEDVAEDFEDEAEAASGDAEDDETQEMKKLRRDVAKVLRRELSEKAWKELKEEIEPAVKEELIEELEPLVRKDLREELEDEVKNDMSWASGASKP
eukprot:TRINITY_DN37068_c0_g1_i1.p1 TRINITY_DN37068_c0_g1~~TRINITY_DN37068_c0_g1_i1.p1  ORF type:complete len:301 (+),score=111.62 TRINITY_DN37068_c0_g1_i1:77-979(+)